MGCCIPKDENYEDPSLKKPGNHSKNSILNNSSLQPITDYSQLERKSTVKSEILTIRTSSQLTSSNYKCFICEELLDLDSLTMMDCKRCLICIVCIPELFIKAKEDLINLKCRCSIPTKYSKLKDFITEEDLIEYLREVSKLAFKLPSSFLCIGKHVNNKKEDSETFASCRKCNEKICLRCLEDHDSNYSCLEFYKKNLPKCKVCGERAPNLELHCKCLICNYCNLMDVKDKLEVEPTKNPECQLCRRIVPDYDLSNIFGGRSELIRFREDALIGVKFVCEICNIEKLVDGSITLYCTHRFCKSCMKKYMETQLSTSTLDKVSIDCPICEQEISYHIITYVLNKKWVEIYERKLLRAMKSKSKEMMKFCNVCDYGAIISIDSVDFECPKCQKTICPKCNNIVSPNCCQTRGISMCEELKDTLVKCPKCNSGIIKENGCNFIKCLWNDCQGVCFCFLCHKILTEGDHYKHFKISGPFGNTCNTLDRID
jgi:hypothetical protein